MSKFDSLKFAINRGLAIAQKHAPAILTSVGITSVVASGVLLVRSTLKVQPILEEHQEATNDINSFDIDEDTRKKELTKQFIKTGKEVVKLYLPPITLGAAGIVAIVSGHGILQKRNVAIAAAYKASERAFSEYRRAVQEKLGTDEEYEVFRGTKKEITKEEKKELETTGKLPELTTGGSQYARVFDSSNPNWNGIHDYNDLFINTVQMNMNDKLQSGRVIFLNDVYDALGFNRTTDGAQVGWAWQKGGDNYIDFMAESIMLKTGPGQYHDTGFLQLDFNVDGIVLHLLDEK